MTQISQSSRVVMAKAASSAFAQLVEGDGADENTLYFVNGSGSFDSNSMETDGDLYLGDKLIGASRAELAVIAQNLLHIGGNEYPLNSASNTTSQAYDIQLDTYQGAVFFDLNLHATIQNLGSSYVNVEIWMERGYYEKGENDSLKWQKEEHIASTQIFIPAYTVDRGVAVCSANIAGHLVGPYASTPTPYLKVCFSASAPVTICSATPSNNLPNATMLTLRCWTPVTVA